MQTCAISTSSSGAANLRAAHSAKRFPIYATMLYVGLLAAIAVGDRLARASGLDPLRVVGAMLALIPVCLAGARALAVATDWRYYRSRPSEILRVDRGGAAMYGALPPAFLLSIPLLRALGLPFGAFWDVAVVAILAGMVPTRFGCLGNGCCGGRPTSVAWGMRSRGAAGVVARRHPTQLLEAALGAALLAGALLAFGRAPCAGAVAWAVVVGYGLGRLALDGLREERVPRALGLGEFQWMSLALVAVGALGLALGSSGSPSVVRASLAAGDAGTLHLVVSGLLLVPIVHLFRFLGCSILLKEGTSVQMTVIVPDLGQGVFQVSIRLENEEDGTELEDSPFDLEEVGPEPDGRRRFERKPAVDKGTYVATCTVTRDGARPRIGQCSGALDETGLGLVFSAEVGDPDGLLTPRVCFEPLPQP